MHNIPDLNDEATGLDLILMAKGFLKGGRHLCSIDAVLRNEMKWRQRMHTLRKLSEAPLPSKHRICTQPAEVPAATSP